MVGFTDVEQSKDVTGNLSQSLALVFLIWQTVVDMSSRPWAEGKIWCQFIPLNNHHRGGGGGPNTHDAAHLTNIWLHKQEAKIDCQVWCATELNISHSESGCRRLRHHRKLSVFGQEVSSFRRAPPIPASNYKQLQKHSSPHGNAAVEGVIDQLEASQHGVQVSVCVHSHRSWRLKTRIFSLHLWRTLFSGLFSPLFVQKEVSVLAIFWITWFLLN